MFGYENWVGINGIWIPATSADTQVDRSKIESSGVYGGTVNGSGRPLGQVHYYDWPVVSASFSAEASPFLLSVLKSMLTDRDNPVSFVLHSGASGTQAISDAWWNSISIQTSEDSAVTANASFTAIERDTFDVNTFEAYFSNVNGNLASNCANIEATDPLNMNTNLVPVPFWNTSVSGFQRVRSWTFNATQDVVRFMGCMDYSDSSPKAPYVFGFGMMTASFKVSTFDELNSDIWSMPDKYSGSTVNSRKSITLNIGGSSFLGMDCELNVATDPLQGANSLDGLEFDYQVYDFS